MSSMLPVFDLKNCDTYQTVQVILVIGGCLVFLTIVHIHLYLSVIAVAWWMVFIN